MRNMIFCHGRNYRKNYLVPSIMTCDILTSLVSIVVSEYSFGIGGRVLAK